LQRPASIFPLASHGSRAAANISGFGPIAYNA
jgi:hypothetical protein